MTGPEQHANTVREGVEIAKDVLANRRSHDVCDRGECFYPTVVHLANALVALAERADTLERERDEALRQRNEWAERVGVLRDLRDREGSWGAPYERAVLATDLAQARAEADRLREAWRHIPGCGNCMSGRFSQCETYTAALAGPQTDNKDSA